VRYSSGGQNDGVWTRVIKDSKIYWSKVNRGTESSYWGEKLTLPVSAAGDIIAEASIRMKRISGQIGRIAVGFNDTGTGGTIRNGAEILNFGGAGTTCLDSYVSGAGPGPLPARPSQTYVLCSDDIISNLRVVRKNGYLFVYSNGFYLKQAALAATITTVDIIALQFADIGSFDMWIDYISVWPREVVTGGP
jgi:hypothetical protein